MAEERVDKENNDPSAQFVYQEGWLLPIMGCLKFEVRSMTIDDINAGTRKVLGNVQPNSSHLIVSLCWFWLHL